MSASDAPVSDFERYVAPAPAELLLDEPISADAQIGSPPALVQTAEAATLAQDVLPRKLEAVTLLGLQKLEQILRIPTNHADGTLLRAQVTAAGAAIHAQVRVDETKMRQKQQGDVLERLLKVMAEEKKKRAVEENEEGAISLKICGRPATNRRTSARRMAATCTVAPITTTSGLDVAGGQGAGDSAPTGDAARLISLMIGQTHRRARCASDRAPASFIPGVARRASRRAAWRLKGRAVDLDRINRRPTMEPLAPTPGISGAPLPKGCIFLNHAWLRRPNVWRRVANLARGMLRS